MLEPWKRKIVLFLGSQTLSLLGSSLVQYAIMWHITLTTQSGLMMTLSIVAGFVPTFFLSPFGGVWADRYDRKKLIILADAGIALVTLIMALVFMAGYDVLWLLFVASAVRAVGTAVQGPAVGAILPQLVPQEQLTRVNGINGTIQAVIMLVSPMISGALLTLASLEAIFFIDVITAVLAIGVLWLFLPVPTHERGKQVQTTTYFADMVEGFRYIKNHRYLMGFFLFIGILFFLVTPAAFLTPLQVTRTFGPDVWRLTAIEIVFSVGMMAGGVLLSAWGGFKNRMGSMVLSTIIMAVCTLALGLVPFFWLYLVCMGLFGTSMPFFNTPSAVMLQEHVEEAFLGRVFSVLTMLSTSLMPLGMMVFGPLADILSLEWILVGTGLALLAAGLLVLGNKRLMEAGQPKVGQLKVGE